MAVRKSAPRWPSLARWSADKVAVTTGRTPSRPSTAQGRSTTLPKPTSATCGGKITVDRLDTVLAETGHGQARVAELAAA
jgi:hypothetical protein